MMQWLKRNGISILVTIVAIYMLYSNARFFIINRRELDTVYGWEITGIYASLAMLSTAFYEPLKANGTERSMNIIIAISGSILFLSWLIVMLVFGDSIGLFDTLLVLGASGLLTVVSVTRLRGISKDSLIVKNTILAILVLVAISVAILVVLLISGIL